MSNDLEKDLDLYLQNLKKESKKPGWVGTSIMGFFILLLFIGFLQLKGIIGTFMLLLAFFLVLMVIGSYMVSKQNK